MGYIYGGPPFLAVPKLYKIMTVFGFRQAHEGQMKYITTYIYSASGAQQNPNVHQNHEVYALV